MPVALFFLFTLFFPQTAYAASVEASAEHSLPFGRYTPETAVRRIARAAAWLSALQTTADAMIMTTASVVKFAEKALDRQALASVVYTPAVDAASKGQRVIVQVCLIAPQHLAEDYMRDLLRERETLELRAVMLRLERDKVEEARKLVQPSGMLRWGMSRGPARRARIVLLAEQLEALWLLGSILPQRRHGRWGEPQAILTVMRQATALYPDCAPLRYLCGEALLQLDRPQDALEELDKALALSPELAGALYTRGLAYQRLQLPALAERDLSAALARDAAHASWWRARGALRMLRNDTGPMCEDFMQACARDDCEGLVAARERGMCLVSSCKNF